MATFVFDRTLADVQAMNAKGTYNKEDLNRVIAACDEIAAELTAAGFPVSLTWSRSSWTVANIPTTDEMQNYLDNIATIKAALPNNAPAVPASMAYLDYQGANDIEKILYEIQILVHNIVATYPRAGVWNSGGVIYEVTST